MILYDEVMYVVIYPCEVSLVFVGYLVASDGLVLGLLARGTCLKNYMLMSFHGFWFP